MGATDDTLRRAIARLADDGNAMAVSNPRLRTALPEGPGLYAWWGDAAALKAMGTVSEHAAAGPLYAGRAGSAATATLRARVWNNHVRGNIGRSTFRLTLAAVLREELHLELHDAGRLTVQSNRELTGWVHDHLSVAFVDWPGDAPEDTEREVLRALDPPLNLAGMDPTPARARLRDLRARLAETAR